MPGLLQRDHEKIHDEANIPMNILFLFIVDRFVLYVVGCLIGIVARPEKGTRAVECLRSFFAPLFRIVFTVFVVCAREKGRFTCARRINKPSKKHKGDWVPSSLLLILMAGIWMEWTGSNCSLLLRHVVDVWIEVEINGIGN